MEDEQQYVIGPACVSEFAMNVFGELIGLLDRKGVISAAELGRNLLKNAAEIHSSERDEAAVMQIRVLGQTLVEAYGPSTNAPPSQPTTA